DERLEVLGRVVRKRLGEEDAGVIDQCVDRLEARQGSLDDLGGSCRLADVAVDQSDVVGSRDLGGLGHLPGIGNDVETPFDKRFNDSRADPLRRSGHDGCLSWAVHGCLPRRLRVQLQMLPWTAVRWERMNLYPLGLLAAMGHPINWLMVRRSLFRGS